MDAKEERRTADRITQMVERFELQPKRVLDVGCRRGYLLQQLQIYNWCHIVGLGNDRDLPTIPETVYSQEEVKGKFDLITAIRTLNGVYMPSITLEWMFDILEEGGTILIEVAPFDKPQFEGLLKDKPHLMLDLGGACDYLIGDKFAGATSEKVYYTFDSPDMTSQEEYLNYLKKFTGKEI